MLFIYFVTNAQFYRTGTCLPSFCQNVTSTIAPYLYHVPFKNEYVIIATKIVAENWPEREHIFENNWVMECANSPDGILFFPSNRASLMLLQVLLKKKTITGVRGQEFPSWIPSNSQYSKNIKLNNTMTIVITLI